MKIILFLLIFPVAVFLLYYILFSIPNAAKKTKEVANEHPQGCYAAAVIIGGLLLGLILHFAYA